MDTNTVSFPLFDANGVRLTFTLAYTGDPQAVHGAVAHLLANGFSANMPGLVAGEKYEEIAYLVRRAQIRDNGTEVPILDLYPEKLNFRFVSTYLDTAEHVAAFESASGLKLADLAVYEGNAPIERGKNLKLDQKYVVRLPRLTKIVYKDNPRFEDGGTKPKRYFERWHAAPPSNVTPLPSDALASRPTPPPASTSTMSATGGASLERIEVTGNVGDAFDQAFPATESTTVGNLNMIDLLNAATKERLVKNKFHFENLIRLLKGEGSIRDASSFEQVLETIRQHAADKLKESA